MKRSEMVNIIVKELITPRKVDYIKSGMALGLDSAERILTALENSGMLPPQNTSEFKFHINDGTEWHLSEFLNEHTRWEPEEEQS